MVQETVRLLVRATRVRKLVPELRDQALKVVRCLYTDVFLREVSQTETLRISLAINVSALEVFENDAVVTVETLIEDRYRKEPKRWC